MTRDDRITKLQIQCTATCTETQKYYLYLSGTQCIQNRLLQVVKKI